MGSIGVSSTRCSASGRCGKARSVSSRVQVLLMALTTLAGTAFGQKELKGWGDQVFDSAWDSLPDPGLRAGWEQTFALRADGSLDAWGWNWAMGLCSVPPLPPGVGYVDVESEMELVAALRSDGSIVVWGD